MCIPRDANIHQMLSLSQLQYNTFLHSWAEGHSGCYSSVHSRSLAPAEIVHTVRSIDYISENNRFDREAKTSQSVATYHSRNDHICASATISQHIYCICGALYVKFP